MELVIAICLVLIIVLFYFMPQRVLIPVAGREWSVIESYPNKAEAAAMLSRLHGRVLEYLRFLKHRWHVDVTDEEIAQNPEVLRVRSSRPDAFKIVSTLLDNYNPDVFYENDPRYSTDTSYTVNKGAAMYICMRQKENPDKLENEDTIFFVMLHECAHIANYNGWGHDDRYWSVFKFILGEAVAAGVYTPVDYDKYPARYCSISIYYQPLNDHKLAEIV
jgi:WLM domain